MRRPGRPGTGQNVRPWQPYRASPLNPVSLERADIEALGAAIQALGIGLAHGEGVITDALATSAAAAPCSLWSAPTPADLVAIAAQAHYLLHLAFAPEALLLLEAMPDEGDWVLCPAEFEKYQALLAGALSVWGSDHLGRPDGLLRWLYLGL